MTVPGTNNALTAYSSSNSMFIEPTTASIAPPKKHLTSSDTGSGSILSILKIRKIRTIPGTHDAASPSVMLVLSVNHAFIVKPSVSTMIRMIGILLTYMVSFCPGYTGCGGVSGTYAFCTGGAYVICGMGPPAGPAGSATFPAVPAGSTYGGIGRSSVGSGAACTSRTASI